MTPDAWMKEMTQCLRELGEIDWGYPLGTNALGSKISIIQQEKLAASFPQPSLRELRGLYSLANGASLPDVHSGYFIHPVERVLENDGDPQFIKRETSEPVMTFGSDGGGGLFAISLLEGGGVYHLPPGRIQGRVYEDRGHATRIAEDFPAFLTRWIADFRAFLTGHENWQFMSDLWKANVP